MGRLPLPFRGYPQTFKKDVHAACRQYSWRYSLCYGCKYMIQESQQLLVYPQHLSIMIFKVNPCPNRDLWILVHLSIMIFKVNSCHNRNLWILVLHEFETSSITPVVTFRKKRYSFFSVVIGFRNIFKCDLLK